MADESGRHWAVVLEMDDKGKVAANVTAGGRLLLPTLKATTPEDAVNYVEAALVDMRETDTVDSKVVCAVGPTQSYKSHSSAIAVQWFKDVVDRVRRQVTAMFTEESGVRTIQNGALSSDQNGGQQNRSRKM